MKSAISRDLLIGSENFKHSFSMKSASINIPILTSAILIITGCGYEQPGDPGAAKQDEQPTNRIEIPAAVRSNLGITFAGVERRQISNTIRVPGSFELMPSARHEYRQHLPGVIQFQVKQFERVEPGQILYRYRSHEWAEIQSEIDLLVASLEQAEVKFEKGEKRMAALARAEPVMRQCCSQSSRFSSRQSSKATASHCWQ